MAIRRCLCLAPIVLASLVLVFVSPARCAPALWKVHGNVGTAYLLGSIHVLPPQTRWRTRAIDSAIRSSNVFVFEIPNDAETQARIQNLVAEKGQLPAGTTLPSILSPEARADFEADLTREHIPHAAIDGKRPWLADLVLVVQQMALENASLAHGVDTVLMEEATRKHLETRYLETLDTQIALLVPTDPKLELDEFEADLREFRKQSDEFDALIAAWSNGDLAAIDRLINGEFAAHPEARKALLDDRNRAWAGKIEGWLGEHRTFFITVGAGHLVGKSSLVELLRRDGLQVEGP